MNVEKIVEKPVIQYVEKPVVHYKEKPVIRYRTQIVRNPVEFVIIGIVSFVLGFLLGAFL